MALVAVAALFLALAFFPVIHVNVDIKIKSKERLGFVVVVFFLPVSPRGHAIYRRNERSACTAKFLLKTTALSFELARWPFDTCQRMPDFDSCQVIFIRMAYITDRLVSICARSCDN